MTVGFRTHAVWFAGAAWFAVLASYVAVGCGGQVDPDGGPKTSEETTAEETTTDGTSEGDQTGADGSGGESAEPSAGELELEQCALGFLPSEDERPCNWLAAGRCYEKKPDACSCICPREGPSICLSDFYGGDASQTKVTCR